MNSLRCSCLDIYPLQTEALLPNPSPGVHDVVSELRRDGYRGLARKSNVDTLMMILEVVILTTCLHLTIPSNNHRVILM